MFHLEIWKIISVLSSLKTTSCLPLDISLNGHTSMFQSANETAQSPTPSKCVCLKKYLLLEELILYFKRSPK